MLSSAGTERFWNHLLPLGQEAMPQTVPELATECGQRAVRVQELQTSHQVRGLQTPSPEPEYCQIYLPPQVPEPQRRREPGHQTHFVEE